MIGGGNSSVEAAIDLAGVVVPCHPAGVRRTKLRADAVLVKKLESLPNVAIHVNAQTTEITGDGQKVTGLTYRIAFRPNASVALSRDVRADRPGAQHPVAEGHGRAVAARRDHRRRHGRTSVPGVFAAGDVTTVPYKQIIIAMGEGAKASLLSTFDHLIRN